MSRDWTKVIRFIGQIDANQLSHNATVELEAPETLSQNLM